MSIISPVNLRIKLNALGMPADKDYFATPNFSWHELLVNQKEIPSLIVLNNLLKVANILEVYRKLLNCPFRITSGWRSEKYNANMKPAGAKLSQHVQGLAIDFIPLGKQVSKCYETLDVVHLGGLEKADWLHIDLRGHIARFNNVNIALASHFNYEKHYKLFKGA